MMAPRSFWNAPYQPFRNTGVARPLFILEYLRHIVWIIPARIIRIYSPASPALPAQRNMLNFRGYCASGLSVGAAALVQPVRIGWVMLAATVE